MFIHRSASVIAFTITVALGAATSGACAIGSRAEGDRKAAIGEDGISAARDGGTSSPRPQPANVGTSGPRQGEGLPPPDRQPPNPESRPPAQPIPDGGSPDDKPPPLPPGFFDAGTGGQPGKATVRDGGAA